MAPWVGPALPGEATRGRVPAGERTGSPPEEAPAAAAGYLRCAAGAGRTKSAGTKGIGPGATKNGLAPAREVARLMVLRVLAGAFMSAL